MGPEAPVVPSTPLSSLSPSPTAERLDDGVKLEPKAGDDPSTKEPAEREAEAADTSVDEAAEEERRKRRAAVAAFHERAAAACGRRSDGSDRAPAPPAVQQLRSLPENASVDQFLIAFGGVLGLYGASDGGVDLCALDDAIAQPHECRGGTFVLDDVIHCLVRSPKGAATRKLEYMRTLRRRVAQNRSFFHPSVFVAEEDSESGSGRSGDDGGGGGDGGDALRNGRRKLPTATANASAEDGDSLDHANAPEARSREDRSTILSESHFHDISLRQKTAILLGLCNLAAEELESIREAIKISTKEGSLESDCIRLKAVWRDHGREYFCINNLRDNCDSCRVFSRRVRGSDFVVRVDALDALDLSELIAKVEDTGTKRSVQAAQELRDELLEPLIARMEGRQRKRQREQRKEEQRLEAILRMHMSERPRRAARKVVSYAEDKLLRMDDISAQSLPESMRGEADLVTIGYDDDEDNNDADEEYGHDAVAAATDGWRGSDAASSSSSSSRPRQRAKRVLSDEEDSVDSGDDEEQPAWSGSEEERRGTAATNSRQRAAKVK